MGNKLIMQARPVEYPPSLVSARVESYEIASTMIAKALTTIFILNFIILLGMVWVPQDNKL
jgi:hypothetical protein